MVAIVALVGSSLHLEHIHRARLALGAANVVLERAWSALRAGRRRRSALVVPARAVFAASGAAASAPSVVHASRAVVVARFAAAGATRLLVLALRTFLALRCWLFRQRIRVKARCTSGATVRARVILETPSFANSALPRRVAAAIRAVRATATEEVALVARGLSLLRLERV